jgi:hypothetical protein
MEGNMFRLTIVLSVMFLLGFGCSQPADEPAMGDWEGTYQTETGDTGKLSAQIIDLGRDSLLAVIWVNESARLELMGIHTAGKTKFSGDVNAGADLGGSYSVQSEISGGKFTGNFKGAEAAGKISLNKVAKIAPTLGLKPPEGAVVLFDGTSLEGWQTADGNPATWEILPDGAMEVRKYSIISKQQIGSHRLHLEFRTPFMPEARGQGRGNSGVYIQGRYEVQVLDSYGLEPADNRCGGIYQLAVPRTNAALPPLAWQAYDITFYAPQFNENGEKIKDAEITVEHNGIVIHDKVVLSHPTPGGFSGAEVREGGLYLQDHGNPVQYRNIWFLPL